MTFAKSLNIISNSKNYYHKLVSYTRFVELMPWCLLIESVNDQLKNICQIEHSRHWSVFNFLVNFISWVSGLHLPAK